LGDVRYGDVIERPQKIFVERVGTLRDADLNAVQEIIVLPKKIFLLNQIV
jgi:hypothetical protein